MTTTNVLTTFDGLLEELYTTAIDVQNAIYNREGEKLQSRLDTLWNRTTDVKRRALEDCTNGKVCWIESIAVSAAGAIGHNAVDYRYDGSKRIDVLTNIDTQLNILRSTCKLAEELELH